jgi:hypothetical protein
LATFRSPHNRINAAESAHEWIFFSRQAADRRRLASSRAVVVIHGLVPVPGDAGAGHADAGCPSLPCFRLSDSALHTIAACPPPDLTAPPDLVVGEPPSPPPRPADLAQPPRHASPPENPEASAHCDPLVAAGTIVGERRPAIADSSECTIDAPVLVEAAILKKGRRVAFAPPVLLNCAFAGVLVEWLREEGAEILEDRRGPVKRLVLGGGYQCRRRNGFETGKISEHARGNALDLIGVEWVRGDKMTFTDPASDLALATDLRFSLCGRFSTVLGPGSDTFHEGHVHIDLEQRASGLKLCEWDLQ